MSRFQLSRLALLGAIAMTVSITTACGGGSIDVGSGGTGISGSVLKGPAANATVVAYAVSGGQPGARIGTAVTDANGNFSMTLDAAGGPVMLQASAGTFRDEATGALMTMPAGDVMTVVLPSVAAATTTNGIQVTPLTSMAQSRAQQMPGGMTEANIAAANAAMGNYFSVSDILHVPPMNPLVPGSGGGASADARNYGMALAAMSQYAKSLNMANSSALVTAMMNDASDGMMDGRKASGPVSMTMGGMMGSSMMAPTAGTSGLATAMTNFAMSPANMSGLTAADVAPLVQRMSGSGGQLR